MRRVSINARTAFDAHATEAVEVALFQIEHPQLSAPVRLSTDPTSRISTDPMMYGTRSRWLGADPVAEPFLFILASATMPSDLEDAPASAQIVLENVSSRVTQLMRSFTDRPTAAMAVVMSDTPDLIEVEYRGMIIPAVDGNAGEITMELSRAPIEEESAPVDRFTKDRFPGLFR